MYCSRQISLHIDMHTSAFNVDPVRYFKLQGFNFVLWLQDCISFSTEFSPFPFNTGCYGISESQSVASSVSSASTEPWFCEACRAGIKPVSIIIQVVIRSLEN